MEISSKPKELGSWNFERIFIPHCVSCVTCHLSHVTCHLSRVTCPVSPVTCHLSRVTCNVSPVKIFFFLIFSFKHHWGLPCLISSVLAETRRLSLNKAGLFSVMRKRNTWIPHINIQIQMWPQGYLQMPTLEECRNGWVWCHQVLAGTPGDTGINNSEPGDTFTN